MRHRDIMQAQEAELLNELHDRCGVEAQDLPLYRDDVAQLVDVLLDSNMPVPLPSIDQCHHDDEVEAMQTSAEARDDDDDDADETMIAMMRDSVSACPEPIAHPIVDRYRDCTAVNWSLLPRDMPDLLHADTARAIQHCK